MNLRFPLRALCFVLFLALSGAQADEPAPLSLSELVEQGLARIAPPTGPAPETIPIPHDVLPLAQERTLSLLHPRRSSGPPAALGTQLNAELLAAKSSLLPQDRYLVALPGENFTSARVVFRSLPDDLAFLRLELPRRISSLLHSSLDLIPGTFAISSLCPAGIVSVSPRPIPSTERLVPRNPSAPAQRLSAALDVPLSTASSGFPVAFETDLDLAPHQCGAPVVDLQGHLLGVSIARSARHATLVIPLSRVLELAARL